MAAVCEVCGKHPSFGMSVSHSHRRTKRRWNPNIQRVRALVNGVAQAGRRLHRLHQGRQGPEGRALTDADPPAPTAGRIASSTGAHGGAARRVRGRGHAGALGRCQNGPIR